MVSGMTIDTAAIVRNAAKTLYAHRKALASNVTEVGKVRRRLEDAATTISSHRDEHTANVATATSHWEGAAATRFDTRAGRLTNSLVETANSAGAGATIVSAVAESLDGNHKAVARLVDQYTTEATKALNAAVSVQNAGGSGALVRGITEVANLARTYTTESAKHLAAAQHELRDSAAKLRVLEQVVEHDGVADTRRRKAKPKHPDKKPDSGGKGSEDKRPQGTELANAITKAARGELGYHEGPGNQNKYGPPAAWCSSFATWVWRKSGVKIPILPFTGDVFNWGKQHGLAYTNLDKVRPGDVLLFGSGPQSTSSSTHIGIVESVHGNQVTLIEGNSSDRVQRVTHTLSSSTFYGGVHPR
jgi:peptidoglycan DL-endopeptidase CwlO